MYIEYISTQRVADPNYTKYDSKGGDFRPTWLIRTSDWKKIPGHEAIDGYHTLSYCWEQSGEKFLQKNGKFGLIDKGRHRLTTKVLEKRKSRRSTRHRWTTRTKHVAYDELLQQVCKDFNIEYLWYDKICIDQANKAEKQREIKQMHLIYSNARYTVALVPEVNIEDPKDFGRVNWLANQHTEAKFKGLSQMTDSLWWKRSWTLEEVMMSTQIAIIGRNTHFWSVADIKQGDKRKENDLLANYMLGFTERDAKSANQVLKRAHFRTSTKEHDKIFALANIFNGIVDIDIDYDSNVSDAMNSFYQRLAEKDLSVMCFGLNMLPDGRPQYETTMDCYNLPSWTGVSGIHSLRPIADITLDQNGDYTIDDNMRLHMKCRSYAMRPIKYNDYEIYENDGERRKKARGNYRKAITSMDDFDGDVSKALDWGQWCISQSTGCHPTHYHKPDDHLPFLSPILPFSLTEECEECVMLGVVFDSLTRATTKGVFFGYSHHYLSPVAAKSTDGSSYRIIGMVLLKRFTRHEHLKSSQEVMDDIFNNLECETQEFCID